MQRPRLCTARESDSRGGRRGAQRTAGVQTPTCDGVRPGESPAGPSPRGAQCPRPHEPLSFRATLQAKHRRAPASIPGPAPDRRGSSVAGGSNGADRRDRAVSGISDGESLHDDVSTGHRDDAERVPQRRQCGEYFRRGHGCRRRTRSSFLLTSSSSRYGSDGRFARAADFVGFLLEVLLEAPGGREDVIPTSTTSRPSARLGKAPAASIPPPAPSPSQR